jgi:hypothetical protein
VPSAGAQRCLFAIGGMQEPENDTGGADDSTADNNSDGSEDSPLVERVEEESPRAAEQFCSRTVESLALHEAPTAIGRSDLTSEEFRDTAQRSTACGHWLGTWQPGPSLLLGARCHHAVVNARPLHPIRSVSHRLDQALEYSLVSARKPARARG